MKAGFARLDMTPPLGMNLAGYFHQRLADGITTPLYINAVALDDGETKAALITLDLEGMNRENNTVVRNHIAERTGIDAEAIFIACTHTHLGPEIGDFTDDAKSSAYDKLFVKKIADTVVLALEDMERSGEAKMFIADGKAEGISFVRLFKLKDGTFKTHAKKDDPNVVGPAGTPDETLQLVKIKREGAKDIAIAHFGTHPDVVGHKKICYDWPGYVREYLEKTLTDEADGKGIHAICLTGAQGDVNHVDPANPRGGLDHAKHMARVIAGNILGMYTYAKEVDCSKIVYKQTGVKVKTAKGTPEEVAMAEKVYEIFAEGGFDAMREAKRAGVITFDISVAYKNRLLATWPEEKELFVSGLSVGEVVFVGFPGEPFTEISRQTKAASQYKMTLPCCHSNGGEGYFPMMEVFTGGGYEATTSRFKAGAAEKLIETAVGLTKEMYGEYSAK